MSTYIAHDSSICYNTKAQNKANKFLLMKPTFFIIGAPRCGTTALWSYLREHPAIFMPAGKELNYFASDHPSYSHFCKIQTLPEYLSLFDTRKKNAIARGEAAPRYVYSLTAPKAIYELNPEAKIIVMLRNTFDMIESWHRHLLQLFEEDEPDFEKAWKLQDERRKGQHIPKKCTVPQDLQYAEFATVGTHLKNWFEIFGADKIKIIFFNDFTVSPKKIYEKVLCFLDVPLINRSHFPVVNRSKLYRHALVGRFTENPSKRLSKLVMSIKNMLGIKRFGFLNILRAINYKPFVSKQINPEFKTAFWKGLSEDIKILSDLTKKDLTSWLS